MSRNFERQIESDPSRPGAQFSEEFKQDAQWDPNGRSVNIVSRDPEVIQRHRLVMEEHFRIHDQTWEPATIINMHPRPLEHEFGYMGHLRVPARKDTQAYYRFTITEYRLDMRDLGGAKYVPVPFMPIQLAKDFCLQFREMGGVFCYPGDRPPKKEEIEASFENMLKWYRRIFRAAQDQWSKKPQHALIDDHMRSAAKMLHEMGEIDQLPAWVDLTRKEARAVKQVCPQCGQDTKAQAKICVHCQWVFDVAFYTNLGFTLAGGIIISRPGQPSGTVGIVPVSTAPIEVIAEEGDLNFRADSFVDPSKQSDAPLKPANAKTPKTPKTDEKEK